MRWILFCTVFCASCMNQGFHLGESQSIVQTMPVTKQKQRIAILQKKLEYAQRNLKLASDEVESLSSEVQQSQLTMIETKIQKGSKDPFLKEREILQQIVENGPSPEAFEARVVLDRLQRITKG